MSVHNHKNLNMLVSVGFGAAFIVASDSPLIQHEMKVVGPMLKDHFSEYPTDAGLYIWEGDISVDKGQWFDVEPSDGDYTWTGAFRHATVADLFGFDVMASTGAKKPGAVPTADVPVLRLKCYHLGVHNMGISPYDSVKGHSGHLSIELVDPVEGTSALVQAWLNDETEDGGPTLRHLEIEDRNGVRRLIAQRRGNSSLFHKDSIRFDTYTDYAGVLPNPGVVDNPCLDVDLQLQRPFESQNDAGS